MFGKGRRHIANAKSGMAAIIGLGVHIQLVAEEREVEVPAGVIESPFSRRDMLTAPQKEKKNSKKRTSTTRFELARPKASAVHSKHRIAGERVNHSTTLTWDREAPVGCRPDLQDDTQDAQEPAAERHRRVLPVQDGAMPDRVVVTSIGRRTDNAGSSSTQPRLGSTSSRCVQSG